MPLGKLVIVAVAFFLTSSISVVTGSTSLITVPVLIAFGIEPHVAVATNMLALVFMSAGGSLPFAQKGVIQRRVLPLGIILTLLGSAVGAFLLLSIPTKALKLTIALAMIAIAIFSVLRHDRQSNQRTVSSASRAGGYLLTFALAIYGGLFSGAAATIGVLLCASKNDEVVEYALSRSLSPALIAEYQTQLPDKKLLQAKLHEFYLLNAPEEGSERPSADSKHRKHTKARERNVGQ